MTEYTTLEMIGELFKDKNKRFSRVGDKKFIVHCDVYGAIRFKLGDVDRMISLYNYQHEKWIEVNEDVECEDQIKNE